VATYLSDLFDTIDLAQAVESGYVRTQTHPALPLVIHNYAEKTVFDRAWTPVTRQCRGLIARADTGEVLARPYEKFWNHSEPFAPVFALDERVLVTDKLDGSLGILYPTGDGGYAIATRGSFASDQAQHATALYQERYAGIFTPAPGMTLLFEILFPENRIVVDYHGLDDLVLLGSIEIATGRVFGPGESEAHGDWPGPKTRVFEYETFAEALAAPPRDGMEGLVIRRAHTSDQVKLKYVEYVRLHRIVTGLNARAVWEALGAGQTAEDICAELPDEFHEWTQGVARDLFERTADIMASAEIEHERILASLPEGHTRKDYALIAKEHDLRAYLFKLADNRDITEQAWKAVYPEGNVTPSGRTFTEATA
jgi:RNA ligase